MQRKHGPRHFPWKDRHPWQAAVGPMGKPILGMGNGDLANAGQSWPKNLQNHNCICWARLIKSLFLWPKSILRPSFRLTGNHDYCTSAFAGGQAPPATRCLIAIRSTAKSAPSSVSVTTLIIIGRFWSSPSKRCLILIGLGHGLRQLLPGYIHSVSVVVSVTMREILHLQVLRVTVTITKVVYKQWHHHIR